MLKEIFVCIFKVLELLNKNKSLDFEALRAFALEDYWSRDKVAMRKHVSKRSQTRRCMFCHEKMFEYMFFFNLQTAKIISSCTR